MQAINLTCSIAVSTLYRIFLPIDQFYTPFPDVSNTDINPNSIVEDMARLSKDRAMFGDDDIFSDVDEDFMVIGDPSRIEWDGDQSAYTPPPVLTPLENLAFTAKASAKSTWSACTWDNAKSLVRAAANEAPKARSAFLAPHKALLNSVSYFPEETSEEQEQLAREENERGRRYTEKKLAERRRLERMNPDAYSPEREPFPGIEKKAETSGRDPDRPKPSAKSPSIFKTAGEDKLALEDEGKRTLPLPVLAWDNHTAESVLEADLEDVARGPVFRDEEAQYDSLGASLVWERPVKRGSDAAKRKEGLLREWRERQERKGTPDGFEETELVPVEKSWRGITVSATI